MDYKYNGKTYTEDEISEVVRTHLGISFDSARDMVRRAGTSVEANGIVIMWIGDKPISAYGVEKSTSEDYSRESSGSKDDVNIIKAILGNAKPVEEKTTVEEQIYKVELVPSSSWDTFNVHVPSAFIGLLFGVFVCVIFFMLKELGGKSHE